MSIELQGCEMKITMSTRTEMEITRIRKSRDVTASMVGKGEDEASGTNTEAEESTSFLRFFLGLLFKESLSLSFISSSSSS